MPQITVRFYGRYLIAEPHVGGRPEGTVHFLAPNLPGSPRPSRAFRPHHSFLAITRTAVDRQQTTLQPSFRTMSDVRARFAELLVWDLAGKDITIQGTPSFRLSVDIATRLVNLCEPVAGIKHPPVILGSGLKASRAGLTSTSVHLNTGTAKAFASFDSDYNFVLESDANDGNPGNDKRLTHDQRLVDVVEVALDSDANSRLQLQVKDGGGATATICVDGSKFEPTIMFTNLCPPLPQLPADVIYDIEFGRYYDYLAHGPDNGPIPRMVGRAGDPGDCNQLAHLPFESQQ